MRMEAVERYQRDPVFHQMVDMMRAMLENSPEITPTELREAVMMAASTHEMTHVKPILLSREEYERYIDMKEAYGTKPKVWLSDIEREL